MNYNFLNNISILEKTYLYLHNKVYQYRLKNQKAFTEKIIISIGNLSTGGTGKTPLTIFLADYFLKKNHKILICTRGYKGNYKGNLLVSENGKILTTTYISGDEAYLIAYKLIEKNHKNFRVVCGKNKSELIQNFGNGYDIVIIDDGLQNPSVFKNIEITLIDSTDDPDKIRLIPVGKYRETFSALTRSNIVILTKTDQNPNYIEKWKSIILNYSNKIFLSNHKMIAIKPKLNSKEIIAVCGIGNPYSFFRILEQNGFNILHKFIYKDHYSFTNLDIQKWVRYNLPIILTEKDWVKIMYNSIYLKYKNLFHRLEIEFKIENDKKFFNEIKKIIKIYKN